MRERSHTLIKGGGRKFQVLAKEIRLRELNYVLFVAFMSKCMSYIMCMCDLSSFALKFGFLKIF